VTPRTRNLRWKERIDRLRKKAPGGVLGDFSEAGANARPFIISGLRHD
jgi:hypothetical protein